eukprot:6185157-Pleurochrysis_carterae.AAC.4
MNQCPGHATNSWLLHTPSEFRLIMSWGAALARATCDMLEMAAAAKPMGNRFPFGCSLYIVKPRGCYEPLAHPI